jgi:hypothetical protein
MDNLIDLFGEKPIVRSPLVQIHQGEKTEHNEGQDERDDHDAVLVFFEKTGAWRCHVAPTSSWLEFLPEEFICREQPNVSPNNW